MTIEFFHDKIEIKFKILITHLKQFIEIFYVLKKKIIFISISIMFKIYALSCLQKSKKFENSNTCYI